MARYVDIDLYLDTVKQNAPYIHTIAALMMSVVPAADVAEVVRCKDCKYSEVADNKKIYCFQPAPIKQIVETEENRFCSYGERRTDDKHIN